MTVNQWFDESIFYENTIKKLYPSVNYKNLRNIMSFNKFKENPSELS